MIRIFGICLLLILLISLALQPLVSDYRDYRSFLGKTQIDNDSFLYVSLITYMDGSLQTAQTIDLQLSEAESAVAYSMISKIENPYWIRKREVANDTTCMRMTGSQVPYAFLCPDYFMVGVGRRIFATSENYSEIYKKLQAYFLTLDPQTHISDRPI